MRAIPQIVISQHLQFSTATFAGRLHFSNMMRFGILALFTFVLSNEGLAATLEALAGAPAIQVSRSGKSLELAAGSKLEDGDRIKTPKNVSATILYPDGSKVEVKPESDFQVEAPVGETQWNRLREGKVRGVISQSED